MASVLAKGLLAMMQHLASFIVLDVLQILIPLTVDDAAFADRLAQIP
jgi:hypothetical protein